MLPADVTHYLIPHTDVVTSYMEILELDQINGVIFPQTVVNSIQQEELSLGGPPHVLGCCLTSM